MHRHPEARTNEGNIWLAAAIFVLLVAVALSLPSCDSRPDYIYVPTAPDTVFVPSPPDTLPCPHHPRCKPRHRCALVKPNLG